jgi:hypothetical protein
MPLPQLGLGDGSKVGFGVTSAVGVEAAGGAFPSWLLPHPDTASSAPSTSQHSIEWRGNKERGERFTTPRKAHCAQ